MNLPFEDAQPTAVTLSEIPLTVKEAARCLGVGPQTVYLWVERKQTSHLRVGSQHPTVEVGLGLVPRIL